MAPRELQRALLGWYGVHARDLPWRRTRDPYALWVSEVMLQQTRSSVVAGYWGRFLERFPTLPALAAAPLDDVLAAWRGLGYYARARNLKAAAEAVVERHGGTLPGSTDALRLLPGFGRYTTGAVASIAFGLPEPVVDGNVARVLSRLFAVSGVPGEPARERTLWMLAGRLVPADRPGDWNQALMELGATVCHAVRPGCLLCPLRSRCRALSSGTVSRFPAPRPRPARRPLRLAAAVVLRNGRLLLGRRPPRGLFGGLWELPSCEVPPGADRAAVEEALAETLGPGTRVLRAVGDVERTLTHRALTLSLFHVSAPARPSGAGYSGLTWVEPARAARLGMSTAMQTALERLDLAGAQRTMSRALSARLRGTPRSNARSAQAAGRAKLSVQPTPKRRGTSKAGSAALK